MNYPAAVTIYPVTDGTQIIELLRIFVFVAVLGVAILMCLVIAICDSLFFVVVVTGIFILRWKTVMVYQRFKFA